MSLDQDQRLHHLMSVVGIRAPITAAAVFQLAVELRRANVLDDDAVERIKEAVAREAFQMRQSHSPRAEFDAEMRQYLDRLFEGNGASAVECGSTPNANNQAP